MPNSRAAAEHSNQAIANDALLKLVGDDKGSLLQFIGEPVRLTLRTDRAQQHIALSVRESSCAAGDSKDRVTRVVEGTLDSNLPGSQRKRPEALPRAALPLLAWDSTHTHTLVAAEAIY